MCIQTLIWVFIEMKFKVMLDGEKIDQLWVRIERMAFA